MPDRCQLLKQINETSFVVNDLNLYLDTHPLDKDALDAFSQALNQRK
ncbi:spore coat protein CotJB, partial [Eggerthella lenta]|nr:spore coat protein CotJB [Eggerthella lenta]